MYLSEEDWRAEVAAKPKKMALKAWTKHEGNYKYIKLSRSTGNPQEAEILSQETISNERLNQMTKRKG